MSTARLALAAALPLLWGCMTTPLVAGNTTGALLPDDRLGALQPGRTTRSEVLDWFGPPLAFARDGAVAPAPEIALRWAGFELGPPPLSLFDKFPAGAVAGGDLVYYYRQDQDIASKSAVALMIFIPPAGGGVSPWKHSFERRTDELWVLIDGVTGVVKAVVFKRTEPPRAPSDTEERTTTASAGAEP